MNQTTPSLQARRNVLGPAYRLFYDTPLTPVRAEGVWLYDADGKPYLDAYNNVPVVGHCHPVVVAAMTKQASLLNTHTRYLHDGVLEYGERLVAKFPAPLDTAMFTCTGSEANDLALRIAHAVTGATGLIVTENAYHGVTAALADMSPSLQPVAAHVRTVPAPDSYRTEAGVDNGAAFAAAVEAAVADLARVGLEPAALLVDTVFASDGIFPRSTGALCAAAAVIRAAGGLFIADEVQGGFGRVGEHWWAFQHDNIIPDIVTMGKPMGNGYPIGGIVLRAELVAEFGRTRRYFNTFGGNTVAAAVGVAVLQAIEEQNLVAQVADVGAYLLAGLSGLAAKHETIGDVRGRGLYLGLELVEDRIRKIPATARAARVNNLLRQSGVLVGVAGKQANIFKIRPPLVFEKAHADLLVSAVDTALGSAC